MISNRDMPIFDWVTYMYLAMNATHSLTCDKSYEDAHRDSSGFPPYNENFVVSQCVLQSKLIEELFK